MKPVTTFDQRPAKTNGSPTLSWKSTEDATFKCSLDLANYEDCGSGLAGTWTKSGLSDGRHVLRIMATDLAGNRADIVTHTWTVGNIT